MAKKKKQLKTVKVRIAVAVSEVGEYMAIGWTPPSGKRAPATAEEHMREQAAEGLDFVRDANNHIVWVEATVPVPQPRKDIKVKGKAGEPEKVEERKSCEGQHSRT